MSQRVVVLGGGISGIAAALRLAAAGHHTTLLEASGQLGGLGTFFEHEGRRLDRFYHCVMPSDAHLRGLLDELGLSETLYWRPTTMGFVHGGRHYDFNSPLDLLRFSPLRLHERLRLGATGLVLRHLGDPDALHDRTTEDWLSSVFGRRIWEAFWQPLFYAKFGDRAATLPARYIWQRLGRESNAAVRGYPRGGLASVIDAAGAELRRRGVGVHLETPAQAITPIGEVDGPLEVRTPTGAFRADWVVSTLPMPVLARAVQRTSLAPWVQGPDLPYQGVVNALFFLRRPLAGHYWLPIVDSGTEFDGLVEMSALVELAQLGGHHLAYIMKYCDRSSALYAEPDAAIEARWTDQLLRVYRHLPLRREDIASVRIFRAPFVEPAYPLGYHRIAPEISVGPSRLVLASTAQVYPHITAWNSAVRSCEATLAHLSRRMGADPLRSYADAAPALDLRRVAA